MPAPRQAPVELVTVAASGKVLDAVTADQRNNAFVAMHWVRSVGMLQMPHYVIIKDAYLVESASPRKPRGFVAAALKRH